MVDLRSMAPQGRGSPRRSPGCAEHVESAERLASLGQVIQMIREFSDFQ
ncbi:hypothetical protein HMPREF3150_02750 [Pseudomonas aeruginosa]|nr:hypothetical protein HMPREF3150_02750 [Pseudomonas aeruginosa]